MLHTILTGCKKARRCGLQARMHAVVLDNAIKSKFKVRRCGLQARMHCSRSVGAPQEATAEIKCSV